MPEAKQTVKERMRDLLTARLGEDVSGEEAAKALQCTRTAVWKAVKSLREDGFDIEAVPKRGYRLLKESRRLNEEAIRGYLKDPEAEISVCDSVSSTNLLAREMALSGRAGHGFCVIAREQTKGRGRRGRDFFSPRDAGLYLSIVVKTPYTLLESLKITAIAAAAVFRAVRDVCGIRLGIKWVNDLYYGGRKVCGILTEAVTDIESGQIQYAVIGIGLNLFPPEEGYGDSLKGIAGALCPSLRQMDFDPNRLAAQLIHEMLDGLSDLVIPHEYWDESIILGKTIRIVQPDGSMVTADAVEILEDGRLVVEKEDRTRQILRFGEIRIP